MQHLSKTLIKRISLLVFFYLLVAYAINAQEIKADSTKFAIGSKVNITLEYNLKGNEKVTWPVFGDTLTKSIEILSKSKIDTIRNDKTGARLLRQQLAITSFDTGFLVVPPISFVLPEINGQIVSTQPLLLEVYRIKVNPAADIKDIKPVIEAPITFREILPWLLGLILLIAVIYGVFYFLKKRKKKPAEQPKPKISIPSWEIALSQLEILRNEKLWQQGEVKTYYTKLTDILRQYFEMRFKVNAAEMTSTEILDSMASHIRSTSASKSLQTVLFLADMAKFAKAQPSASENEKSIDYAIEIINQTKPLKDEQQAIIESKKE